jgi:hypothetical protein
VPSSLVRARRLTTRTGLSRLACLRVPPFTLLHSIRHAPSLAECNLYKVAVQSAHKKQ